MQPEEDRPLGRKEFASVAKYILPQATVAFLELARAGVLLSFDPGNEQANFCNQTSWSQCVGVLATFRSQNTRQPSYA